MEDDAVAEIRLLDASGRLLQQAACRGGRMEFDVEKYSGVLFVQVVQEGRASTRKVIVL